jgi:hypothetical protein
MRQSLLYLVCGKVEMEEPSVVCGRRFLGRFERHGCERSIGAVAGLSISRPSTRQRDRKSQRF